MTDQYTFRNPVTAYGKISPPEQHQPEPGLDAGLEPKADLGDETYRGTGRLEGRKAVVTGADSGIGAAAAIAFAREGADVVLSCLPEEEDASRIAGLIKAAGRKAVKVPGDLQDPAACRDLVDTAVAIPGGVDVLVNNAGINNFTKGLAQQLAPKGIRVNAVAPGPVWTPLQVSSGQPKEKLPKFGQSTPLGRAGQPAELAPAYVFLASAESSFVVGKR